MRGAKIQTKAFTWLCMVFVFSCVTRTRANETSLPFRVTGIAAYQSRQILVWNEEGFLAATTKEERGWGKACKVPIQNVNQLITIGADIYIVGAADANARAALRINNLCEVLDQWRLPAVWADLVVEHGSPFVVSVDGLAPLNRGGQVGATVPYARTGNSPRSGVGTVHWLSTDAGNVLCRNRDQSRRGDSPGWCALQKSDGWLVSGNYTDAIGCAGLVLVKESLDAQLVRWTSLSPSNGQKVAEIALPRGIVRCVDGRFLASADRVIRVLDAKTLHVVSMSRPNEDLIGALVVLPEGFKFTCDGRSIRSISRRDLRLD